MIEEYLLQVWSPQLLQFRSYVRSKIFFLENARSGPFSQIRSQLLLTLGACARVMVIVCVCVCVCYCTSGYIPPLYVENKVPLGFLWRLPRYALCGFRWRCFVQKFWRHLLTTSAPSLLDKLSMDKRDSDGFFPLRLISMSSDTCTTLLMFSLQICNMQL